jgi:hypothetical protein
MIPTHAGALMPHGGDPYFDSVVYLHHFDAIGTPTVFTDVEGNVWTRNSLGGGELDQRDSIGQPAKFPPACGYFGNNTGSNPTLTFNYPDFDLDPSNLNRFTLECWMVPGPFGVLGIGFTTPLSDIRLNVQNRNPVGLDGQFSTGVFSATGGSMAGGVFTFIEGNYDGVHVRVFVGGVMVAKVAVSPGDPLTVTQGKIGMFSASPGDYMYIDEARFTPGICRHATDASYSVPTRVFPDF